jgi:hypothetical protein
MNTTRIRQALDLSRSLISDHIEETEFDACIHDKQHKPMIETMIETAKPGYRRCLRAVKLIDEALKEIEP